MGRISSFGNFLPVMWRKSVVVIEWYKKHIQYQRYQNWRQIGIPVLVVNAFIWNLYLFVFIKLFQISIMEINSCPNKLPCLSCCLTSVLASSLCCAALGCCQLKLSLCSADLSVRSCFPQER